MTIDVSILLESPDEIEAITSALHDSADAIARYASTLGGEPDRRLRLHTKAIRLRMVAHQFRAAEEKTRQDRKVAPG